MEILKNLSENEKTTIRLALQATCEGDFFDDNEFQTLIGVDRKTVHSILIDWPTQKVDDEDFICAIKWSMIMLLIYPHGMDDDLNNRIPGGADALKKLLDKLF